MPSEILAMLIAGAVQGIVTWAAVRVEIRYLRRDVDRAHWRLDQLPCSYGRRSTDDHIGGCHGQGQA